MNTSIGKNLKRIRKDKGWSQEQVADYLNLSQSTYARIENGESHSWSSHLDKLCEIFEVTPEELVKSENLIINKSQKGGTSNNAIVINQLSDKLIGQYEERIKELKETIEDLRKHISSK